MGLRVAAFLMIGLGVPAALWGWHRRSQRPPSREMCVAFASHEQALMYGDLLAKAPAKELELEVQHCLVYMSRAYLECYRDATTAVPPECDMPTNREP